MASPMSGFDDSKDLYLEPILGVRIFGWNQSSAYPLRAWHHDYVWRPGTNERYCYQTYVELSHEWKNVGWGELFDNTDTPGPVEVVVNTVKKERRFGDKPHPIDICSCGYYAFHDRYWLDQEYGTTGLKGGVSGVIAGTGEVLVGTRGFRAEKARIVALAPPLVADKDGSYRAMTKYFASLYKVPYFTSRALMLEEFPPTYIGQF